MTALQSQRALVPAGNPESSRSALKLDQVLKSRQNNLLPPSSIRMLGSRKAKTLENRTHRKV